MSNIEIARAKFHGRRLAGEGRALPAPDALGMLAWHEGVSEREWKEFARVVADSYAGTLSGEKVWP